MNIINSNVIILRDEGFGINKWLMVPHKEPRNEIEKQFNRTLVSERMISERCFGMLKRRFPMLTYKIRIKFSDAPGMILCGFMSQNIK